MNRYLWGALSLLFAGLGLGMVFAMIILQPAMGYILQYHMGEVNIINTIAEISMMIAVIMQIKFRNTKNDRKEGKRKEIKKGAII